MVVERDEIDELLPGELVGDALTALLGELIAITFETFPDTSSAEHRAAMIAVLESHARIKNALRAGPALN